MSRNIILSSLTRTRTRILVSFILLFFTMTIILFYSAGNHRSSLIELRKGEIRRQVEIAMNTIRPFIDRVDSGDLSREEALERIVPLLRRMILGYKTSGSLCIWSYDAPLRMYYTELQCTYILKEKKAVALMSGRVAQKNRNSGSHSPERWLKTPRITQLSKNKKRLSL